MLDPEYNTRNGMTIQRWSDYKKRVTVTHPVGRLFLANLSSDSFPVPQTELLAPFIREPNLTIIRSQPTIPTLDKALRAKIEEYYRDDFVAFGYERIAFTMNVIQPTKQRRMTRRQQRNKMRKLT